MSLPVAVPSSLLMCCPHDYDVYRTPHFRAYVVAHHPTGEEARVTYADVEARTGASIDRLGEAGGEGYLLGGVVVQLAWERLLALYLTTKAQRDDYAAQLAYLLEIPRAGLASGPT
jgi:hypothetical protein